MVSRKKKEKAVDFNLTFILIEKEKQACTIQ